MGLLRRRRQEAKGGRSRPPRTTRQGRRLSAGVVTVVFLTGLAVALLLANQRNLRPEQVETSPSTAQQRDRPGPAGQNPVQVENALPGSTAWQRQLAGAGAIEGYPSETSVLPGSMLRLHVSTQPAASYRVDVFRLGWYQGAGARRMACLPGCSGQKPGTPQPTPPPDATGEVRAGWPATDEIAIAPDWVSGYYVAKLVLVSGPQEGRAATVPFIVRAPSSRRSAILVQAPVNTWQAYNSWGGKSLYDFNSSNGVPATRVSFERPIIEERVLNYPFTWEYPLVRFLEREGYDVAYATNVDTHRDPMQLQRHRLVMTAGHDEYWTKEIRDGLEAALAARTNLAFMGANTGVWQVRYENSERTMVGYKSPADPIADPSRKTVRFRELQPPRPECRLLGVQSAGGLAAPNDPPRNYTPTDAATSDRWFAGTGLTPSSVLRNLVGYEWDTVRPGCETPPLTVLFHYEGTPSNGDAVRYVAPSGAKVFSAGSLQYSWGLDDWSSRGTAHPGLQRFVRNALAELTEQG